MSTFIGDATIKLECTGCDRRFRLKPIEGKPLPDEVQCPRCGSTIAVPQADLGWEKRQISRVFGREDVEPERPETGGHAPTPEKKSRVFRDVTQVNPTPVSRTHGDETTEPKPATAAAGPEQSTGDVGDDDESLGERLRKLKRKRLDAPSLDDESDARADTAVSDDELDAEFEAIVDEAASAVDEASEAEEAADDSEETEATPSRTEPPPTPDLGDETVEDPTVDAAPETTTRTEGQQEAPDPSEPSEQTSPQSPVPNPREPSGPPYTVRVDDEVHTDLTVEALAELVRSGVWTEVVEIQTEQGNWVRLTQSGVMEELRAHLSEQAKTTLKQVATGEWERDDGGTQGSPTEEPGAADHVEATRDESERNAEKQPDSSGAGSKALVGMLVVFALAAAIGVYQWQVAQKDDETTGAATSTPASSTNTSADKETEFVASDPFEAARAVVSDAYDPARATDALADAGHYKAARHLAIDTWAAGRDVPGLQAAFDRAIEDDPALHPEVETLGEDIEIDRVFALGGGRSISFRLTNDGRTRYAFKPEQKEWGRGWRAELAAYLFCEVVICQFEVPKNQPVRISRETFEELYGLVETYRQARYAERFEDLHWKEERGPDGKKREYLYGVLEEWVPGFIDWPIEYTSIWADWLDVRYHPGVLEEPLVEELAPLQDKENSNAYSDILSERGDATTRDIARQLSSMLLFDFLTSNWDRFSDVEDYYGVNNQFADGRFVSLDLGAAFYDEPINKVASRFDLVTRFSARTVASVRALKPDVINPLLFPEPTSKEKYRLALFWTQHDEAIQRIDALIQKYGRDRVLEFE